MNQTWSAHGQAYITLPRFTSMNNARMLYLKVYSVNVYTVVDEVFGEVATHIKCEMNPLNNNGT